MPKVVYPGTNTLVYTDAGTGSDALALVPWYLPGCTNAYNARFTMGYGYFNTPYTGTGMIAAPGSYKLCYSSGGYETADTDFVISATNITAVGT
jgi:hypothetical protein